MWSEKYRPNRLNKMVGNDETRGDFVRWLQKWKPGAKAAILVGPPGTGKTTCVHLAAEEFGLQIVELNASDTRTKDKLSKRIGEIISSLSLFQTKTLIFLDEVDGLAGRADYGAIDFIREAVRRSDNPVVMAANDPESDEVKKLSSVTKKFVFQRPPSEVVTVYLSKIAKSEGISIGSGQLSAVVESAHGDLRSALNFLQSGEAVRKDEEMTISESVNLFFDAVDEKAALKALRAYPGQPREKVRDLFTGVIKAKIHEDRKANALEVLSRADLLLGQIMSGKDWRLLRYLDPMLASNLWRALGDGGATASYSMDGAPWPLQVRIWNDSKKLKELALLAGRRLKISQRGSLVEDMPYIMLLCRDTEFRDEIIRSLDLEENYAAFVSKEAGRVHSVS